MPKVPGFADKSGIARSVGECDITGQVARYHFYGVCRRVNRYDVAHGPVDGDRWEVEMWRFVW